MMIQKRQLVRWAEVIACAFALTACAGGTTSTATPPGTAASGLATLGANVAPPASPTAPLALTPLATIAASPSPASDNITAATPTPLINGFITTTARSEASTTSTSATSAATVAPSTAVTGGTSGTRVVSTVGTPIAGGTSAVSGSIISGTRTTGTTTTITMTTAVGTGSTTASAATATTRTATTAGSATTTTTARTTTTTTTAVTEPTETVVPVTFARGTAEQFLDAVVAKGDISPLVSPALRSQAGSDSNKLLGIMGPIRMFTIDSEKVDADGNGAIVHVTITTAMGATGRDFRMKKSNGTWLVDNITT